MTATTARCLRLSPRRLAPRSRKPALFASPQLTPSGEYTRGIERPAIDAGGALFVAHFQRQGAFGKLSPGAARSELPCFPPGALALAFASIATGGCRSPISRGTPCDDRDRDGADTHPG